MDNKKFEEGIDFLAQLFESFLELRKWDIRRKR